MIPFLWEEVWGLVVLNLEHCRVRSLLNLHVRFRWHQASRKSSWANFSFSFRKFILNYYQFLQLLVIKISFLLLISFFWGCCLSYSYIIVHNHTDSCQSNQVLLITYFLFFILKYLLFWAWITFIQFKHQIYLLYLLFNPIYPLSLQLINSIDSKHDHFHHPTLWGIPYHF